MILQMAASANNRPKQEIEVKLSAASVQEAAAKLYGQGFTRAQIAQAMLDHLYPADGKARNREQKLSHVRAKLRRWEMSKTFRDMVWKHAVVKLDMATPSILIGLSKKARLGRVDAAKLVLEITERHSTREDAVGGPITVNIANIPRPEGNTVLEQSKPEEKRQLMRRTGREPD